jgi:hypothetical protein
MGLVNIHAKDDGRRGELGLGLEIGLGLLGATTRRDFAPSPPFFSARSQFEMNFMAERRAKEEVLRQGELSRSESCSLHIDYVIGQSKVLLCFDLSRHFQRSKNTRCDSFGFCLQNSIRGGSCTGSQGRTRRYYSKRRY